MKWEYWQRQYLETHCTARGLRPKTIAAYKLTLDGFRSYIRFRASDKSPEEVTAKDVLEYVDCLRRERGNGDSAVNRQVTVVKNFYRAMVALGHLKPNENPMAFFPKLKKSARKLPETLKAEEVKRLLSAPRTDTVMGLRDRAILVLLYGTGIRASECAELLDEWVDLDAKTIRVTGKGGHERSIPLNEEVAEALRCYRESRGPVGKSQCFFRSRKQGGMSRNAIYERVRTYGRRTRIAKRVSPHRLRHTFATDLVRAGVNLVTIRDLLGHRQITSTQIYLHSTAEDLRYAAQKHPVSSLINKVAELLPGVVLPFQHPPKAGVG